LFGGLCEECAKQVQAAQPDIRPHVTPKECFVTYDGSKKGWRAIVGTGCAHWVAHQLRIRRGRPDEVCAEGYTYRVVDVIAGARKIDREWEEVRHNDIWVDPRREHCGLVVSIKEVKVGEEVKQAIAIMHCASAQFGGGERGVVTDDFERHFKGRGDFYRF